MSESEPEIGAFFDAIDDRLLDPRKLPYYDVFARSGEQEKAKQFEGWFAGELAYLFSSLRNDGQILRWENEVQKEGIGRIDFVVTINGYQFPVFLELKALCLGKQGEKDYQVDLSQYHDSVRADIRKLARCEQVLRYCLLFVYPLPTRQAWDRFVKHMKSTEIERKLIPVESYYFDWNQYPPSLGVAKLELLPPVPPGDASDEE